MRRIPNTLYLDRDVGHYIHLSVADTPSMVRFDDYLYQLRARMKRLFEKNSGLYIVEKIFAS